MFSSLQQLFSLINQYIDSKQPLPIKTELALTRAATQHDSKRSARKMVDIASPRKSQNSKRQGTHNSMTTTAASMSKDDELSNTQSAQSPPAITTCKDLKSKTFVIQKYLEKPLLIKKRKFDIRLWVCVTHDLKCFLFREGYIRMSSREYTLNIDQQSNPFVHLTNNAIQKNDKGYGQFEEANMLSFSDASDALRDDEGVEVDFY